MTALVLAYFILLVVATATAKGSSERVALRRHVSATIVRTQTRQLVMGLRPTPTHYRYKRTRSAAFLAWVDRWWGRQARAVHARFVSPPHKRGWLCIHSHEGSWRDGSDPYWGGLQMDRTFMRTYAPRLLLRRGWADHWTPLEQMWVAERAHRSGRGYGPWPRTARYCGLL